MADDLCFLAKDSLIIKPQKKNPLLMRMVVLIVVMVCGVYISIVCLRQIGGRSVERLSSVEVAEKPCELTNIEPLESRFLHFPKPESFSRGECACNAVQYFSILSTQRSGSGWFETLLNSHTNISSNGEIFSVKVRRSNVSTIVDTLDKIYNLDWFTSASKNECTAAVGLKWMLNQGLMQHHEEIVNYFNAKGVSVIFLFRRNLLRRMISVLANSYDQNAKPLNGIHKSHVHSHEEVLLLPPVFLILANIKGRVCSFLQIAKKELLAWAKLSAGSEIIFIVQAEILANYKPKINTTTLIPNLKQLEDLVTKSLDYFKNTRHIILYYEDIIKNRKKLVGVQDFLRVPRMNLRSRQVKIHKGSLSSQVENWEDVKKTLQGTSYEKFLDQDYKL